MAVADTDLSRWLLQQYGPGTRFKSARQLSLAAGHSETTVSRLIERGQGSADTLIAIARAAKIDPLVPLVMAGWITEAEASAGLSPDESMMVRKFRQLDPPYQKLLLEVATGFLTPRDLKS